MHLFVKHVKYICDAYQSIKKQGYMVLRINVKEFGSRALALSLIHARG